MTPQFAALLESVPESQRRGRVFKLLAADGSPLHAEFYTVSRIVCAIGKSAGVVVDERTKRMKATKNKPAHDAISRKFASAHDLRRSFGRRWAMLIKQPVVLKDLMRHESITTTLAYYVGADAEEAADAIWEAAGNTLGNTPQKTSQTLHETGLKPR